MLFKLLYRHICFNTNLRSDYLDTSANTYPQQQQQNYNQNQQTYNQQNQIYNPNQQQTYNQQTSPVQTGGQIICRNGLGQDLVVFRDACNYP